jgi:hypothetical protein
MKMLQKQTQIFVFTLVCNKINKAFQGFEHLEAQIWRASCRAFSSGYINSSLVLLGLSELSRILSTSSVIGHQKYAVEPMIFGRMGWYGKR